MDEHKIKSAEWKLLDTANPAFRPVGFREWGKNMQGEAMRIGESPAQYWSRMRDEAFRRRTRVALA